MVADYWLYAQAHSLAVGNGESYQIQVVDQNPGSALDYDEIDTPFCHNLAFSFPFPWFHKTPVINPTGDQMHTFLNFISTISLSQNLDQSPVIPT